MDLKSSNNCNTKNKNYEGASTCCKELVLFNIDSLFRIASYIPAADLLNLSLSYRRLDAVESDNSISLIEDITRQIVQDIVTDERNTGESWLGIYHYLRLSQDIRIGEDKRSKNEGESWSAYYQHLESVRSKNSIHGKLIEDRVNEAVEVLKGCYYPTEEVKLDPEVEKKWDAIIRTTEPTREAKEMFAKYQGRGALHEYEGGGQKVEGGASPTSFIELVLFNSDSLFKISSYLPAVDLLNLALTCKRFGGATSGDDNLSLIEVTARRVVQDIAIATGEERPKVEGESWLENYHYLQSVVIYDHLLDAEYKDGNTSCLLGRQPMDDDDGGWALDSVTTS